MAKRPDLTNLLKRTDSEAQPGQAPAGKNKPLSVYLSSKDRARMEAAAAALGVPRHSLLQYAVLDFLARYERGDVQPETQAKNTLKAPK
jgi:hypothetical protein